ncbi:hypothetical protein RFI_26506, partial [Reticulomyxa filosa]
KTFGSASRKLRDVINGFKIKVRFDETMGKMLKWKKRLTVSGSKKSLHWSKHMGRRNKKRDIELKAFNQYLNKFVDQCNTFNLNIDYIFVILDLHMIEYKKKVITFEKNIIFLCNLLYLWTNCIFAKKVILKKTLVIKKLKINEKTLGKE